MLRKRKAVSPLLAGTLYLTIAIVVIAILISTITPYVQSLRDKAAFESAKTMMHDLATSLQEIIAEGKGSTRVVPLVIRRGVLIIDNRSNLIEFRMKTDTPLVARSAMIREGNIIIAEGDDVSVVDNGNVITMRNSYLEVNITKAGTPDNWQQINMSRIIAGVKLLKENVTFNGTVRVLVDSVFENATGYIYAEMYGNNLPRGRVIAHLVVNDTEFELLITLPSYADYLELETREAS